MYTISIDLYWFSLGIPRKTPSPSWDLLGLRTRPEKTRLGTKPTGATVRPWKTPLNRTCIRKMNTPSSEPLPPSQWIGSENMTPR